MEKTIKYLEGLWGRKFTKAQIAYIEAMWKKGHTEDE